MKALEQPPEREVSDIADQVYVRRPDDTWIGSDTGHVAS